MRGQNRRLTTTAMFMTFLVTIGSFGPFNPFLTGDAGSLPGPVDNAWQSNYAFALWLGLLLLTFIPGAMAQPVNVNKLKLMMIFIGYSAVSALWSTTLVDSVAKAMALILCTTAAVRLASVLSIGQMLDCLRIGLTTLTVVSAILAVAVPSIGVNRYGLTTLDFNHATDWVGVFADKQSLGFASAYCFYLNFVRFLHRRSLVGIALCAIAMLVLIESGCRGAALIVVMLVFALVLARTYLGIIPWLSRIITVELGLGAAQLVFFAFSGYSYVPFFGEQIDFTDRTFIWQYAANYWTQTPYFGVGLNGFWTNPIIHSEFNYFHHWVLDNFHSGYIGIFVETGGVGFALFTLVALQLRRDMTVRLMRDRLRSVDLETAFGILLLTFTINLTETYFLRSTNLLQGFFTFMLVKLLIDRSATRVHPLRTIKQPVGAL